MNYLILIKRRLQLLPTNSYILMVESAKTPHTLKQRLGAFSRRHMSDKTQAIIDRAEELCALSEEEEAEKLVRDALEKETTNLDLKTKLATILSRRGYDHKTEDAQTAMRTVQDTVLKKLGAKSPPRRDRD